MLKRKDGESYLAFVDRATQELSNKQIGYEDWSKAVLGEIPYGSENLRRCSLFLNKFLKVLDNEEIKELNDDERIKELERAKEELEYERKKIQTCNLEYNANVRAEVRNRLFKEQIISAIKRLEPIKIKTLPYTPPVGATGLLCISDFHAGDTFKINGLYGEVVNEFSFDILCSRLEKLTTMLVEEDNVFDELYIANLGDIVGGKLRNASLLKLREPVCDTVMRFAEWYSQWVADLQDRLGILIHIVTVSGNHDITRDLTSKVTDENENVAKYWVEFIKLRLQDNPYIVVNDCTDVAVKNIHGSNVMFNHGQNKNLGSILNYYCNIYNISCDYIFAGHLHSSAETPLGITDVGDAKAVRVGSLMGIDSFAKRIEVGSRPSAHISIFTDEGRTWNRDFFLG